MTTRSIMSALLVAGACMAFSAPAMARDRQSSSSWGISINLGNDSQWRAVPGTSVYEMYGAHPSYDAFRYGNNYYVYDHDQWYRSRHANGRFARINDGSVPRDFHRVSRDHWRDESWRDRWDRDRGRRS